MKRLLSRARKSVSETPLLLKPGRWPGHFSKAALATAMLATAAFAVPATAQSIDFAALLTGASEVPAAYTSGAGLFTATVSEDGTSVSYGLNYLGMTGTVSQAHIHFGQPGANGGIVVFLCTNLTPPAGVPAPPACPQSGGVSGSFAAANITGSAAAQGIAAGELDKVLNAMETGAAYVNIHSSTFPSGEIRGQVNAIP